MVWWLIMIASIVSSGGTTGPNIAMSTMHVGNFKNEAECERAASGAKDGVSKKTPNGLVFICVQASADGDTPAPP
jgi:hypothetical protein